MTSFADDRFDELAMMMRTGQQDVADQQQQREQKDPSDCEVHRGKSAHQATTSVPTGGLTTKGAGSLCNRRPQTQ